MTHERRCHRGVRPVGRAPPADPAVRRTVSATVFPIQRHRGEGGDPGLERQPPPHIPPLDPGLRRGDMQSETGLLRMPACDPWGRHRPPIRRSDVPSQRRRSPSKVIPAKAGIQGWKDSFALQSITGPRPAPGSGEKCGPGIRPSRPHAAAAVWGPSRSATRRRRGGGLSRNRADSAGSPSRP